MTWQLIALFAGAVAAGALNVLAGGGALITVPLLLGLGVPETTANGTGRLGVAVQSVMAAARYQREGAVPWKSLGWMSIPMLMGTGLGAWAGTLLSPEGFRGIMAVVTLGVGALVVANVGTRFQPRAERHRAWVMVGLVIAGFYGGMIQAGVGYLLLAVLTLLAGLDLVTANILKILLVLVSAPLAIVLFWQADALDWRAGSVLSLGQGLGGWLGAGLAVRRGARFLRWVLAVALLVSFVSLIPR